MHCYPYNTVASTHYQFISAMVWTADCVAPISDATAGDVCDPRDRLVEVRRWK